MNMYYCTCGVCSAIAPTQTVPDAQAPEPIEVEARRIVSGDRPGQYGTAEDNFTRIGRKWGATLGVPDIPPETVALMMVDVKTCREAWLHKRDNVTDMIGYAICLARIQGCE